MACGKRMFACHMTKKSQLHGTYHVPSKQFVRAYVLHLMNLILDVVIAFSNSIEVWPLDTCLLRCMHHETIASCSILTSRNAGINHMLLMHFDSYTSCRFVHTLFIDHFFYSDCEGPVPPDNGAESDRLIERRTFCLSLVPVMEITGKCLIDI